MHSRQTSTLLRWLTLVLPASFVWAGVLSAQQVENSTKRDRIEPSAFARQCGSAVSWRNSISEALRESKESGKPVFWYVPGVEGTFMDRSHEVNRYMLAGPFSWPAIIDLLNENFIPVKQVAGGDFAERLALVPYEFVEPGYVIVDSRENVLARVDQLTTQHPELVETWIRQAAALPNRLAAGRPLDATWEAFSAGDPCIGVDAMAVSKADEAERILLQGMILFRQGNHDEARRIWATAREIQPDHPLAWKALAEAENWGPFCRGFEVFDPLPASIQSGESRGRGSAASPNTYCENELWQRGSRFLLNMQRADGGWFDSDYDFGGSDSLPNVHAAITALCGIALVEALDRPGVDAPRVRDSIQRVADFLCDARNLNPVDRDELIWAHAYRIRFLIRMVQSGEHERQRYGEALAAAVAELEGMQMRTGAWFHEYPNPFVTATALDTLALARAAGVPVDAECIERGIQALSRDRFPDGAWPYSGDGSGAQREDRDDEGETRIQAAAGRMPLCEMALWRWNASSHDRLQTALEASLEHHDLLARGFKYDNHTSTLAYGGFFFWYDMLGRAEAIALVRDEELRERLVTSQRGLVMQLPEIDGCFVDSHELGRCYGTAMALQTLAILQKCSESP